MKIKLGVLFCLFVISSTCFSQRDTLIIGKQKFPVAKLKLLNPPPGYDINRVNDTIMDVMHVNGNLVIGEQVMVDSTAEKPMVTRYNLSPATITVAITASEVKNTSVMLKSGKQLIYFNDCSIDELVNGVLTTYYIHGANDGRVFAFWDAENTFARSAAIKQPGLRLVVKDLYYTKGKDQYALDIQLLIITK